VLVVAVLSLKGGVGKTTVSLGLAGAALRAGIPTLVVDLDPQANATVALDPAPTTATLTDVLTTPTDPRRLAGAIAASAWGDGLDVLVGAEDAAQHDHPDPDETELRSLARALDLLPRRETAGHADSEPDCSHDTRDRDTHDRDAQDGTPNPGSSHPGSSHPGSPHHDPSAHADADGAAPTLPGPYRLVIIDCPPSLGRLTRCALTTARRAVLVSDASMFAVAAVQRAFEAVQGERERTNPDLQPLAVLVNRVRPRNAEHEFRIGELRELFGPLVLGGLLPDRIAVQQAQGACLPVQRWDTPGGREVSAVFAGLLGRVLRSEHSRKSRGQPQRTAS